VREPITYVTAAKAPAMPTKKNPIRAGIVTATGASPPNTQASWKRVSNRAKARP